MREAQTKRYFLKCAVCGREVVRNKKWKRVVCFLCKLRKMNKIELKNFTVVAKSGAITFKSPYQKALFKKYLQDNEGKSVYIALDTRKPKRSDQQNRLYWLYLNIISAETGTDPIKAHEFFRGKFLSLGIKEIFGERTRIKKSTTELNKSEFCEYLLKIQEATGVPIPDTSLFDLAPLKE